MSKNVKKGILVGIDVFIVLFSILSGIVLSLSDLVTCLSEWWFIVAAVLATVVINFVCRLYNRIWHYAGTKDVIRLFIAGVCHTVVYAIIRIV